MLNMRFALRVRLGWSVNGGDVLARPHWSPLLMINR